MEETRSLTSYILKVSTTRPRQWGLSRLRPRRRSLPLATFLSLKHSPYSALDAKQIFSNLPPWLLVALVLCRPRTPRTTRLTTPAPTLRPPVPRPCAPSLRARRSTLSMIGTPLTLLRNLILHTIGRRASRPTSARGPPLTPTRRTRTITMCMPIRPLSPLRTRAGRTLSSGSSQRKS